MHNRLNVDIMFRLSFFVFFSTLTFILTAQSAWVEAHWQLTDGTKENGTIYRPRGLLADNGVLYRRQHGQFSAFSIPDLRWLAVEGDTILRRELSSTGKERLWQLLTEVPTPIYIRIELVKGRVYPPVSWLIPWRILLRSMPTSFEYHYAVVEGGEWQELEGEAGAHKLSHYLGIDPKGGKSVLTRAKPNAILRRAHREQLKQGIVGYSLAAKPVSWEFGVQIVPQFGLLSRADGQRFSSIGGRFDLTKVIPGTLNRLGFQLGGSIIRYRLRQDVLVDRLPFTGDYFVDKTTNSPNYGIDFQQLNTLLHFGLRWEGRPQRLFSTYWRLGAVWQPTRGFELTAQQIDGTLAIDVPSRLYIREYFGASIQPYVALGCRVPLGYAWKVGIEVRTDPVLYRKRYPYDPQDVVLVLQRSTVNQARQRFDLSFDITITRLLFETKRRSRRVI